MRIIIIVFLILGGYVPTIAQNAEVYPSLCEQIPTSKICKHKADTLFDIIRSSKAFDWSDKNNNCEDRANAVSLILDSWNIPNGKAWIFQGSTFDKTKFKGNLGGYTYHVATCILVSNANSVDTFIIDPLMNSSKLLAIKEWAELIAVSPVNVYFITSNRYYQQSKVCPTPNWKMRDEYFDDTIDGLTRYNNFSIWTRLRTKKYLKRRASVLDEFNRLKNALPTRLEKIKCG